MRLATTSWLFLVLIAPGMQPDAEKSDARPASPAPADDIEGYYSCTGRDNDKNYTGLVEIKRFRKVYLVQWLINGETTVGVGIRQGDRFSVGWGNGKSRGTHQFRIEPMAQGAKLVGVWVSLPGSGESNSETLTFMRPLPTTKESK